MINHCGRHHKPWVDCTPDNAAQRVPSSVIEPIMKLVKAFFCQEFRCAVVEVGIKLMDHHFIS